MGLVVRLWGPYRINYSTRVTILSQLLLSPDRIEEQVEVERQRAEAMFPRWNHPYRGVEFSRARRILGQAHHDGRVKLSLLFVDTQARDDLVDTIRHEFAHLIAGLSARHGPRWKAVAQTLGATPRASGRALCDTLSARLDDAPFSLVAVMATGEELVMKPAYRRSQQYLQYRYRAGHRDYFYRGEPVLRFRYVDRKPSSIR